MSTSEQSVYSTHTHIALPTMGPLTRQRGFVLKKTPIRAASRFFFPHVQSAVPQERLIEVMVTAKECCDFLVPRKKEVTYTLDIENPAWVPLGVGEQAP